MPKGYPGRFVTAQEASRRWRKNNPEKVRAIERRRKKRAYDPVYHSKWYAGLSPEQKTKMLEAANRRLTRVRRWLDAYKMKMGCIDCGYRKHHAALHFDHVRGKKIMNVANVRSISRAKIEIEKCEVRCANCHSVRTFKFYPVNYEEVE